MSTEVIWTEKTVLDAIEPRYRKPGNGGSGEYAFMRQVRNDAGFNASRTFDAVAVHLWPSRGFQVDVLEVKISRSDWLRELNDPAKAEAAFVVGDRFIVAAPAGIVQVGELPPGWGLLEVTPKRVRMTVQPKAHTTGKRDTFRAGFVIAMLRAAGAAALETSDDREVRRRVDEKVREVEAAYRKLTEQQVQQHREHAEYALTVLEHARVGRHLDAADAGRKIRAALDADRNRDALVSVLRNQHDRLGRMIADLEEPG